MMSNYHRPDDGIGKIALGLGLGFTGLSLFVYAMITHPTGALSNVLGVTMLVLMGVGVVLTAVGLVRNQRLPR